MNLSCHALAGKRVGPSFKEVSTRRAAGPDASAYLAAKILASGSGVWRPVPMPPQTLADQDAKAIAQWLADGAHKCYGSPRRDPRAAPARPPVNPIHGDVPHAIPS